MSAGRSKRRPYDRHREVLRQAAFDDAQGGFIPSFERRSVSVPGFQPWAIRALHESGNRVVGGSGRIAMRRYGDSGIHRAMVEAADALQCVPTLLASHATFCPLPASLCQGGLGCDIAAVRMGPISSGETG
jgi:hypothetical protein